VHLGFEVRVELDVAGEGAVSAQITRHDAEQLELVERATVWVRTTRRTAVPA
jgi:sulfate transport system ATP-binding protein